MNNLMNIYKAKTLSNEWIEGELITVDDKYYIKTENYRSKTLVEAVNPLSELRKILSYDKYEMIANIIPYEIVEVNKYTIRRWCGFYDELDRKVFEDDIVVDVDEWHIWRIRYNIDEGTWVFQDNTGCNYALSDYVKTMWSTELICRVIGTFIDEPHLLDEENYEENKEENDKSNV